MTVNSVIYDRSTVQLVLEQVRDPEIPVLSIEDMGIIKDITVTDHSVHVSIIPTYSGCPAMNMIENDINSTLRLNGYENISVDIVLDPAWSSDFISEEGRKKLREFGIAPPNKNATKGELLGVEQVHCPQCGSSETEVVSQFGSTACKALYKCLECLEPFDYFKCV